MINADQNKAVQICFWVSQVAYLNLLWLAFTLLGGIVLGIMPATTALYSLIRKWLMKEDTHTFDLFFSTYKAEWIRSNYIGYFFLLAFGFFCLDVYFAFQEGSVLSQILVFPLSALAIYSLGCFTVSFPVMAHFRASHADTIRYILALTITKPFFSLSAIVAWVGTLWMVGHYWILVLYCLGVVPAFYIMKYLLTIFPKK